MYDPCDKIFSILPCSLTGYFKVKYFAYGMAHNSPNTVKSFIFVGIKFRGFEFKYEFVDI